MLKIKKNAADKLLTENVMLKAVTTMQLLLDLIKHKNKSVFYFSPTLKKDNLQFC